MGGGTGPRSCLVTGFGISSVNYRGLLPAFYLKQNRVKHAARSQLRI
jgi:hypothetical protein